MEDIEKVENDLFEREKKISQKKYGNNKKERKKERKNIEF